MEDDFEEVRASESYQPASTLVYKPVLCFTRPVSTIHRNPASPDYLLVLVAAVESLCIIPAYIAFSSPGLYDLGKLFNAFSGRVRWSDLQLVPQT